MHPLECDSDIDLFQPGVSRGLREGAESCL